MGWGWKNYLPVKCFSALSLALEVFRVLTYKISILVIFSFRFLFFPLESQNERNVLYRTMRKLLLFIGILLEMKA